MTTARKILSNTVWQVFGKIAIALLGVVTVKLITNYLSTGQYGDYTIIYEYIAFFGIAADFGLFTIAVREMSKDGRQTDKIVGNVLSLRTFLSVLVLSAACVIAFFIPKYRGTPVPVGVIIGSVTTALILMNGAIASVLQTRLRMERATVALVVGKILIVGYLFATIFFLFPNKPDSGFFHLIFAGVIGNGVMLTLTYFLTRPFVEIRFRFDFDYWRKVLFASLPYGLALVLSTIYFRIDSILLYFMRSSHEVGIYGVPIRIMEMVTVLSLYFMNSVLPVLTKHIARKTKRAQEIIQHSFDFLFTMSLPVLVGGFVLAFPLIFAVASPQFLSGWHCTGNLSVIADSKAIAAEVCEDVRPGFTLPEDASYLSDGKAFFFQWGSDRAFQIILIAVLFSFLNSLFVFTLIAAGRQTVILWINLAGVIFNLVSNIMVIPAYGFVGAATTTVVTECLILIAAWAYARRHVRFSISFGRAGRAAVAAVAMGATIWALQKPLFALMGNKHILILIPLGALIYAGLLLLTRAVTPELIRRFKN